MDARFVIFVFSLIVSAYGETTERNVKVPDNLSSKGEEMKICLAKENITEEEMANFLLKGEVKEDSLPLKKTVLCFLQRIEFFDGITWNMQVITESEKNDSKMLQAIKDCLEEDNFMLEAYERAYQVQKCVMDKTLDE